jgi:membrane protein required for colicin V production
MLEFHLWNWLDWILALIVVVSVLSGASEGFVRGLVGLISLFVGLIVAAEGYHTLGAKLGAFIHSADIAQGIAFLLLFLLVIVVGSLLAGFVQKVLKEAGLSWFDRLLGLLFGLIRGVIMDAVVIMAMLAFGIEVEVVRTSRLTPSVIRESRTMAALMPPDLRREFNAGLEDLKRGLVKTEGKIKESAPARQ